MSMWQATTATPSIRASYVGMPAAAEAFRLDKQGHNPVGWPR